MFAIIAAILFGLALIIELFTITTNNVFNATTLTTLLIIVAVINWRCGKIIGGFVDRFGGVRRPAFSCARGGTRPRGRDRERHARGASRHAVHRHPANSTIPGSLFVR